MSTSGAVATVSPAIRGRCGSSVLSRSAADGRFHDCKPVERRVMIGAVVRPDDHPHAVDLGMIQKGVRRVTQDRRAAERQILLRRRAAEARSASSGEDQGDTFGHWASGRYVVRADPSGAGVECEVRIAAFSSDRTVI